MLNGFLDLKFRVLVSVDEISFVFRIMKLFLFVEKWTTERKYNVENSREIGKIERLSMRMHLANSLYY